MTNGSGVSRGDRNRNVRLARLRELVPLDNAIVGIDLADKKQMVVVTDHDSKVLARKTFRCRAWDLGAALDWAAQRAAAKGWSRVTISCEPTGHRWRVLGQLAADRGMPFVCVQPLVTSWARRAEDLTFDKTDDKDAVLIARLTAQLRCYVPEPVDETWGRLRHLGARRDQLIIDTVAQVQQMRDLLECVWPAALLAANWPFRSKTWAAAMWVVLDRDDGDLARTQRLGPARFETVVRQEITKRGGQKPCLRIVRKLFAALADPTGVTAHRRGALERVKHAGLAPREKLSGTFTGRAKLSGQGRPGLRLAAWRTVWGALQTNTVYAARYRHLTTREENRLTATQAQAVIAATILRHLHAVITTGSAWDPVIATHGTRRKEATTLAA
jgi:transposase